MFHYFSMITFGFKDENVARGRRKENMSVNKTQLVGNHFKKLITGIQYFSICKLNMFQLRGNTAFSELFGKTFYHNHYNEYFLSSKQSVKYMLNFTKNIHIYTYDLASSGKRETAYQQSWLVWRIVRKALPSKHKEEVRLFKE